MTWYVGSLHPFSLPHCILTPTQNATQRVNTRHLHYLTPQHTVTTWTYQLNWRVGELAGRDDDRKVVVRATCQRYRHLSTVFSTCTTCAASRKIVFLYFESRDKWDTKGKEQKLALTSCHNKLTHQSWKSKIYFFPIMLFSAFNYTSGSQTAARRQVLCGPRTIL
jgi:hypothetical protein